MHVETARELCELIAKDDKCLDILGDALAKRKAGISAKPKAAPVATPEPAPAPKPFTAKTPKADKAFDSE